MTPSAPFRPPLSLNEPPTSGSRLIHIALERLSRRGDFTSPDDYVFVNRFGRRIDPVALTRRFGRAREAAGLAPMRFHGLRHTYGSLLVAGGIDLASVKSAMRHAQISTTER